MQFLALSRSALMVSAALVGNVSATFSYASETEVVTVQGQRINEIQQVELLTQDAIAVDFSDVLDALPSIDINNNGAATNVLQYRGMFGDRVNIMVDGAVITGAGPNAMDSPLSHVISEPGMSALLHRGIAPVSAGPETLGGHVELKSNNSQFFLEQSRVFGQVGGQTQTDGDVYQSAATLGYGANDFYAMFTVTSQQADEMEDGNGQLIPNFRYKRRGGKAKLGFKHGDHQWHLNVQRLDTDDAGTPALGMDIVYIDATWYRLNYQYSPEQDKGLRITVFGNDNEHGMNNIDQRPTMNPMARLNTVDATTVGFDAIGFINSDLGKFEVGVNWQDDEHNSVITNPVLDNLTIQNFTDISRELTSAFGQWSYSQSDVNLSAGVRYTQVDSRAGEVGSTMAMMNPNVAALVGGFNSQSRDIQHNLFDITAHLDYAFSSQLTGTLALAQKTRAPSYTELYTWLPLTISAGLADGFTYLGNLGIQEETANQIDLGLNWFDNGWRLSTNIYYQSIDDYILGSPSDNQAAIMITAMMGNPPPLQWQNVDATIWGAEVAGQVSLTPALTLSMTANMVRGKRDDIDDNLFRMSPNSFRAALIWKHEALTLNAESVVFARQDRVSALQNEQESAGYGLVNLSASYQISPSLSATLNANNVLDKAYQPHLAGVNRVRGTETPVGERLFAPGRQIMASLQYRFGL